MSKTLADLNAGADDGVAFEKLAGETPPELFIEPKPSDAAPQDPTPPPPTGPAEKPTLPDGVPPVGGGAPEVPPAPAPEGDELEKQFQQIEEESKEAHPNVKKGIALAREIAKRERLAREGYEKDVRDAKAKAEELEKKLLNPIMPEKEMKELEELRQLRREVDIENDPQFRAKYIEPLKATEESIISTLQQIGLKEDHIKWIQQRGGILNMVSSNRMVDKDMSEAQWVEEKLLARAPAFYRDRIKAKLNQAYDLQEDANKEAASYAGTAKERAAARELALKEAFESGIKEEFEALGDSVKKLEIPPTASPEERTRITKHNERVTKAETAFKEYLKTGSDQKVAAKLLVRAAHSQFLQDAMKDRDDRIKELEEYVAKVKASGDTSHLGTPSDTTKPQTPDKKTLMTETDDHAIDRLMTRK